MAYFRVEYIARIFKLFRTTSLPPHPPRPYSYTLISTIYKKIHISVNSSDKIENEMGGHVARMGETRGVYRVLVGKTEGKRPLGRPRRRWEDNIKIGLQEVGCGGMDWIELAQDRDMWQALVSTVMNFRVR